MICSAIISGTDEVGDHSSRPHIEAHFESVQKLDQQVSDGYSGYRCRPQLPHPYHINNGPGAGEDIAYYKRPR